MWGKNPHTLLNFFRNKLKNEEEFEIKDVYRYLVDKEEFLYWVGLAPEWNCEMNIIGKTMKVKDIVEMLKKEQGKPVTESEALFTRMPIRH